MKTLAILLLAVALTIRVQADDNLVVNGDFAEGHAHWKGDAKDPDGADGGSVDLSNPAPTAGVIITLQKDKWSKMYQLFSSRAPRLHYSVTFTLSPDYKPDHNQPEGGAYATPGLDDIENVYPYYGIPGGGWMMILSQTGLSSSSFSLRPDVRKKGPQTLSGMLRGAPDENDEMTVVFAFPPGEGSINITKVTLTGEDK